MNWLIAITILVAVAAWAIGYEAGTRRTWVEARRSMQQDGRLPVHTDNSQAAKKRRNRTRSKLNHPAGRNYEK